MPIEIRKVRLTANHQLMMAICHMGKTIGLVYPYGVFYGQIVPNPLFGRGFGPDQPWFIFEQGSPTFVDYHKLIATALARDGKKISDYNDLMVGLPKYHIHNLCQLDEIE